MAGGRAVMLAGVVALDVRQNLVADSPMLRRATSSGIPPYLKSTQTPRRPWF